MYKRWELLVREPRCDTRSEQGRLSYGWQRVGLPNGGRFIRRAKKEGRNSNWGVWYRLYVSCLSSIWVREPVERFCSYTRHLT